MMKGGLVTWQRDWLVELSWDHKKGKTLLWLVSVFDLVSCLSVGRKNRVQSGDVGES